MSLSVLRGPGAGAGGRGQRNLSRNWVKPWIQQWLPARSDDSHSPGSCPLEQEGLHKDNVNLRVQMQAV